MLRRKSGKNQKSLVNGVLSTPFDNERLSPDDLELLCKFLSALADVYSDLDVALDVDASGRLVPVRYESVKSGFVYVFYNGKTGEVVRAIVKDEK